MPILKAHNKKEEQGGVVYKQGKKVKERTERFVKRMEKQGHDGEIFIREGKNKERMVGIIY